MINLETTYTPNVNAADANYNYGSFRNDSNGAATDGTPLEQAFFNDINGFFQSIVVEAGVVPNNSPDTATNSQIKTALKTIIANSIGSNVPQATTAVAGKTRYATNQETIDGLISNAAVTPLSLAARTATTGRRGLAQAATNQDAIDGFDTEKYVTPSGLSARTATQTRTGISELATPTEINAANDASRIMSVKDYADALTAALSGTHAGGSWTLPGGIGVRFGVDTQSSAQRFVTFTTPFLSECLSVIPLPFNATGNTSCKISLVGTPALNGFTVYSATVTGGGAQVASECVYLAFGK